MEFSFENEILVIIGLIIGLVFVLKIICGFITRLVELRASRRILGDLYEFTNKTFKNIISYANDEYTYKEDEKDII